MGSPWSGVKPTLNTSDDGPEWAFHPLTLGSLPSPVKMQSQNRLPFCPRSDSGQCLAVTRLPSSQSLWTLVGEGAQRALKVLDGLIRSRVENWNV